MTPPPPTAFLYINLFTFRSSLTLFRIPPLLALFLQNIFLFSLCSPFDTSSHFMTSFFFLEMTAWPFWLINTILGFLFSPHRHLPLLVVALRQLIHHGSFLLITPHHFVDSGFWPLQNIILRSGMSLSHMEHSPFFHNPLFVSLLTPVSPRFLQASLSLFTLFNFVRSCIYPYVPNMLL